MSGFNDAIVRSARSALCGWSNLSPGLIPQIELIPGLTQAYRNIVCDLPNPGTGQVVPGLPGLGGQCEVTYQINTLLTTTFNTGAVSSIEIPANLLGPISGARIEQTGSTSRAIIDHAGTSTIISQESFTNRTITDFEILTITRADGLPDTCGFLREPEPPTYEDTVPDPDNPGGPNIPIVIAPLIPVILPNGTLNFPVTINGPNFEFPVEIPITLGGEGCGCEIPVFPSDPPELPADDPSEPGEGEEPPEPGDGDENNIVGVIVTVLARNLSPATVIGGGSFPELGVPRLGSVSFAVQVNGVNCWTRDYDVKADRQFIPIDGPFLAYSVSALPIGATFELTPVRITEAAKEQAGYL